MRALDDINCFSIEPGYFLQRWIQPTIPPFCQILRIMPWENHHHQTEFTLEQVCAQPSCWQLCCRWWLYHLLLKPKTGRQISNRHLCR